MLRRWWYRLYILVLVAIAVAVILPMFAKPDGDTTESPTSLTSLDFYSASVPLESRLFIGNWLRLNKVTDTTPENITIQAGSLQDSTYRFDSYVYRNVSLIMDSKNPHVSYTVNIELDPSKVKSAETTIGCPASDKQRGSAAKCQEMLRI